ncbi:MAG: bifunctional DNA-binding transcriptional regulator/O6-methylguanine-DNA methyltransferase Ada, partial [Vicinamibacterales bacterium]
VEDARWQAVLSRDARADGRFVYGVRSTRIYCRPSCPSRRPRRESVLFFASPDSAEVAGFRECRRCRARAGVAPSPGLAKVRKACAFIAAHVEESVTLARIAAHVDTGAFHLQRTFTRLVGISPRGYQDALKAARFRSALRKGAPVAAATYGAGYGSSSRVYEGRPTGRGMTPATYRRGGAGTEVTYTTAASPLGRLLVAGTSKGICAVKLGDGDEALEAELRREFAGARMTRDRSACAGWVRALVAHLEDRLPHLDLPVDVRATAFQWKVWRYLQSIPYGTTRSYGEVARAIGSPSAVRAVARACATNQVCLIIPCHRVVQKDGGLAGFRWGVERKQALLDRERAQGQRSKVKGQKSR